MQIKPAIKTHTLELNELFHVFLNRVGTLCIVIGIAAIVVLPRILSLESHCLADEELWMGRSYDFLQSLINWELDETVTVPHPGVTTMWLGGIGLWLRYKDGLSAATNLATKPFFSSETLATARIGVVVITIVAIFIAWYLLFKLFGPWKSYIATLLVAVDPFYLALSRMLHTDALAASFTLLSVLFILVYLERSQGSRYVVFSGFCFGLACLSKVTTCVLALYLPLLLVFYRFFDTSHDRRPQDFSVFPLYLTWFGTAFVTVICLWPRLWTTFSGESPILIFVCVLLILGITHWGYRHIRTSEKKQINRRNSIISSLMIAILGTSAWYAAQPIAFGLDWATRPHEVAYLFFGKLVNDPGALYYPLLLSFRSLPFTIPLCILGFIWVVCNGKRCENRDRRIFLALLMFILVFVIPLSLMAKKISRYILPVLPFLGILAAIGFSILAKEVTNLKAYGSIKETMLQVKKRPLSYLVKSLILIFIMLFQIAPVLSVHPDYIAYHNPIWKVADVPKLFAIGGEVGSDKAALYLNRKPNAKQLTVRASPIAAQGMNLYFTGRLIQFDERNSLYPDYEVIHLYDVQLGRDIHDVNRKLEHVIRINGIDFVWIYGAPNPHSSSF